ncbi:MAG: hypothetical protein MUC49_13050 [Raineya sp.]|jgi:hypothetical protein|nr:hypothetical protein [Raineya sp.]
MANLTEKRLKYKPLPTKKAEKQPQNIKKAIFSWGQMSVNTNIQTEEPSADEDLSVFINFVLSKIQEIRNSKTKDGYGNC